MAKRSGRIEDWEEAKRLRNKVGRDLENLRADFLKNQQEINKDDPKKFWRTVSSIIPKNKAKSGTIWLKDKPGDVRVPTQQSAAFVNKFFTNIGPELARGHNADWSYFGKTVGPSIDRVTTNIEEVVRLVKDINTMKSSGLGSISSRICKDAFMVLSEQLVHMFNSSLNSAMVPTHWKTAKVVPLFKGGNREDVSNYRPVSLLPLPGKLLERIVHDRITKFWEDNDFLLSDQGGFRKGHSTLSTVADLSDDIFNQVNGGNITMAVFVDLRKAFDTVDLGILLKKLSKAGIRDNTLAWCENYLSGRRQCTVANGVTSVTLPIACGVPQGSVLGPLFFLVYVNDVQAALDVCKVKLYADDTVLYQSEVNSKEACTNLQRSLDLFVNWCTINKLTININKTKVMAFGTRHKVKRATDVNIVIGNERLKVVPSYKYLGLTMDSTLNYSQHISTLISTVLHKLSLLAKMKRYLRDDVAINIYKTMLLPYFDNADVIYARANSSVISKLQKVQNKCLKLCLGKANRFSTNRLHNMSNVPFLDDRRSAHTLNFMYKRKSRQSLMNVAEIGTRAHDAPLFTVRVPRCEAFKRSVGYFGAVAWNDLPPNIRNTGSYLAFKRVQKQCMLQPLAHVPPN